jgi:hypothetical protein
MSFSLKSFLLAWTRVGKKRGVERNGPSTPLDLSRLTSGRGVEVVRVCDKIISMLLLLRALMFACLYRLTDNCADLHLHRTHGWELILQSDITWDVDGGGYIALIDWLCCGEMRAGMRSLYEDLMERRDDSRALGLLKCYVCTWIYRLDRHFLQCSDVCQEGSAAWVPSSEPHRRLDATWNGLAVTWRIWHRPRCGMWTGAG